MIKVTIDADANRITVWNNGKSIPVTLHKKEGVYIPELVFGHLLTSSNYNDSIKKIVGGRNGYGAKLTNIFSKQFKVTVCDAKEKKKFTQVFKNNMSVIGEPKLSDFSPDSYEFTEVQFEPDLRKFSLDKMSSDMVSLLTKRVYDLAGCTPASVVVYLNGKKLTVKSFKDYVGLYFDQESKDFRHYESVNPRWEVCVAQSDQQF